MSDFHERLTAAVNARLDLARTANFAYPGPWEEYRGAVVDRKGDGVAYDVPGDHLGPFFEANDPATVIRHCERDLKVLSVHQWRAPGVNCGCDKSMCSCGEHVPWPCEELVWLAEAYAVPFNSVLSAPQPERGGSPKPPR